MSIVLTTFGLYFACFLFGRAQFRAFLPDDMSYMSHSRTNIINSLFIVFIFLRHIDQQALPFEGVDLIYRECFDSCIGQFIVSSFFFFSGFGVMKSIEAKGNAYLNKLVTHRFVKLYFNAAFCILLVSVVVGCIRGKSLDSIIWDWLASLGLSDYWFIIMTLSIYIVTRMAFLMCSQYMKAIMITAVSIFFLCNVLYLVKPLWWLDTELCFPAGMILALYECKFREKVRLIKLPIVIVGAALVLIGVGFTFVMKLVYQILYSIHAIVSVPFHILTFPICCVVVLLGILLIFSSLDWKKEPAALNWLGGNAVLWFYIMHFMPIYIVKYSGLEVSRMWAYVFILVGSVWLAFVMQKAFAFTNKYFWK